MSPLHPSPPSSGLTPVQFRLLALAAALLAVGWLVSTLSGALAPFITAALLAYACDPLVARLQRHGLNRSLGSAVIILVCGLIFLGLALTVIPLIIELSGRVATRLPKLLVLLQSEAAPWIKQKFGITLLLDLPHLSEFAQKNAKALQDLAGGLLNSLSTGGMVLLNLAVMAVLVPVVLFYLLVDWKNIQHSIDELIPRRWEAQTRLILGDIDSVLGQFLRGQLMVMLSLAAYYSLALAIAGVEFALPLGLITGLLIFIPYVGFSLGLILALLSALLQDSGLNPILAVAGIFAVGQLLESFALTPWLVGERIGLHPVVVIFALLAFGQLFGFIGLLIALPAAACLLVGLRVVRQRYLASDIYQAP